MTDTERERIYRTAVRQLHADAVPIPHISLLREPESLLGPPEREQSPISARCPLCHDPDSDPKFDGLAGIVCDICGEPWIGRIDKEANRWA